MWSWAAPWAFVPSPNGKEVFIRLSEWGLSRPPHCLALAWVGEGSAGETGQAWSQACRPGWEAQTGGDLGSGSSLSPAVTALWGSNKSPQPPHLVPHTAQGFWTLLLPPERPQTWLCRNSLLKGTRPSLPEEKCPPPGSCFPGSMFLRERLSWAPSSTDDSLHGGVPVWHHLAFQVAVGDSPQEGGLMGEAR